MGIKTQIVFSISMLLSAVNYSYAGGVGPFSECVPGSCGDNAYCESVDAGSYCQCKMGFSIKGNGDNLICTDDNECLDPSVCGDNSYCENTAGGFSCLCKHGFSIKGDGNDKNCTGTCGTTTFSNAAGIIRSPGYPNNYPNGANCTYIIEIGDDWKVLELDVFVLDIKGDPADCVYDWLDIKGRRICGNAIETIIHYETNDVLITFNSDGIKTGKGFQILYKVMSQEDMSRNRGILCYPYRKCENFCPTGYVQDDEGERTCPSCACQSGTDPVPQCGDKVSCPCGYGRDSQQCPTCDCGERLTPMLFFVPPENIKCIMAFDVVNTAIVVGSPGFDGISEYPADALCSVTLNTGTGTSTVHLNFTFLDIEASEGCEADVVTFLNVRICGQQSRTYTIENVPGELIIYFASDRNSTGNRGFVLEVHVLAEPSVECSKDDTQSLLQLSLDRISLAEKTLSGVIFQALSQINGSEGESLLGTVQNIMTSSPVEEVQTEPQAMGVSPEIPPPPPPPVITNSPTIKPPVVNDNPLSLPLNEIAPQITTVTPQSQVTSAHRSQKSKKKKSTKSKVKRHITKKPKFKTKRPTIESTRPRMKTPKKKIPVTTTIRPVKSKIPKSKTMKPLMKVKQKKKKVKKAKKNVKKAKKKVKKAKKKKKKVKEAKKKKKKAKKKSKTAK